MASGTTIIEGALQEIGVLAAGESATTEDLAWGLAKFNRILDSWNARSQYVYTLNGVTQDEAGSPATLVFQTNTQTQTIGPSGHFVFNQRPVKIEFANVILNNVTPVVRVPINIRDDQWWASNAVRGVTATFPTDLYYSPDLPNGTLSWWPVPTTAYQFDLWIWKVLAQLSAAASSYTLIAPGYQEALTYTLAESLAPSYGKAISQDLHMLASTARETVRGLNSVAPRIATMDSGMPKGGKSRPAFNYLTGGAVNNR